MATGLCLAFLLPNHEAPWQNFFHEYLAALAFVPVVVVAFFRGLKFPPLARLFVFLALVAWGQYFSGQLLFAGDAWLVTLYLLGGACVIAAGHASESTASAWADDEFNQLIWASVVFAGLLSVGIALHQWMELQRLTVFLMEVGPGGRPYANLGQPNHLATLLLLGVVGCWYLWERRRIGSCAALFAALFLVFGLALTASRTPLVASLLAGAVVIYFSAKGRVRASWKVVASILSFYAILMLSIESLGELLYLGDVSAGAIRRSAGRDLRLEIWNDALQAIIRSPWLGYGWLQTPIAQLNVANGTQTLGQLLPSMHNLILDLAVWLGVPLLLLVALVFAMEFVRKLRFPASVDTLAPWLGVGIIGTHAMLEYAELYAYFFVPACWWLGQVSSRPKKQTHSSCCSTSVLKRSIHFVMLSAVLLLLIVAGWEGKSYQSDWEIKRYRSALMDKSIEVPERDSVVLSHWDAFLELSAYDPFFTPRETPPKLAESAAYRFPYPSNLLKLAIIQAINGQESEASETMNKLCMLYRQVACESARATWVAVGKSQIPELARVALKPLP